MSANRNLNFPLFSGQWCDGSGNLTPLAQAAVRCLWSRTGNAPGIDASSLEAELNVVSDAVAQALQAASSALDEATALLLSAQAIRAEARKALEEARDSAILAATAGVRAQAAPQSDEGMVRQIMIR